MSSNSAHSRGANSAHSRGNLSPKPTGGGAWGKGGAAAAAAIRAAPPPAPVNPAMSPVPPMGTPSANRVRAFSGSNIKDPAQQGQFASTSSHHRRKRFSHPTNKGPGASPGGRGSGGDGRGEGGGRGGGGGGGGSSHQRSGGYRNHSGGGVGMASPGGSRHGMQNSTRLPPHIANSVPLPPSLTPTTTPKQHGTPKHHHHPNKKRDLLSTGQGTTAEQKAVQRVTAEVMLSLRLSYLEPPVQAFAPPEGCAWTNDPTRISQIEEMAATRRQGGEVSKVGPKQHNNNNINTTAPALEDCAPLQVNEETRWKAKVFASANSEAAAAEAAAAAAVSREEIFAKALLILNKLSWTTMDKLSQELMNMYWEVPLTQVPPVAPDDDDGETTTEAASAPNNANAVEVLRGIIRLIVQKAQAEPHFAGMYAQLCATLHTIFSNKIKEDNRNLQGELSTTSFSAQPAPQPTSQRLLKKILLEECQEAFHQDSMQRLREITQKMTDPEEIEYHANLIRKHYVGLMRFLGELYCRDMMRIGIMIWCLKHLLQLEKADELSANEGGETETPDNGGASCNDNKPPNEEDNGGTTASKTGDEPEVEEEKLECFAKLITTIGSLLEQQALTMRQDGNPKPGLELQDCWEYVYLLAGRAPPTPLEGSSSATKPPSLPVGKVSNRLKFMLQDLIEMKENGWVSRRAVDAPKTIAELHQDVANEAAAAQQQSRRSSSSNNLRATAAAATGPPAASPMPRRSSDGRGANLRFKHHQQQQQVVKPGRGINATVLRRSVSDGSSLQRMSAAGGGVATASGRTTNAGAPSVGSNPPPLPPSSDKIPRSKSMSVVEDGKLSVVSDDDETTSEPMDDVPKFSSPDDCGEKMKKIIREYFVGGDTDEAILSIHEIVGASAKGSIERGAKVVEAAILLVLEMKTEEVKKLITIFSLCAEKGEIEKDAFEKGLSVPLEFLNEIEIDAPLAGSHMVAIVSELRKLKMFSLSCLRNAPEMFLTEGKPARFAAKIVQAGNGSVSGDDMQLISDLMNEEDRTAFPSAAALLSSMYESTA